MSDDSPDDEDTGRFEVNRAAKHFDIESLIIEVCKTIKCNIFFA